MNILAVILAAGFIMCFLFYQFMKSHVLSNISRAMQKQDYQQVRQLSEKKLYQKLMGAYVCDLYLLRALLNGEDVDGFKEYLTVVLDKPYTLEQRKEILDIYYYHFIFKKDQKWSAKLLKKIQETNDLKYIEYNTEAYEVMIEEKTDLLNDMIAGIENKKYSGLGLGIAVFMIGMQYLLLDDKENARTYFYNSLSCFSEKSFYYAKAKSYVDQLTDELGADSLNY